MLLPQQYTVINKNNQTTSTECQYHIAKIKPLWCLVVKWLYINLKKDKNKQTIPTNTWNPCKPVNIKNTQA